MFVRNAGSEGEKRESGDHFLEMIAVCDVCCYAGAERERERNE